MSIFSYSTVSLWSEHFFEYSVKKTKLFILLGLVLFCSSKATTGVSKSIDGTLVNIDNIEKDSTNIRSKHPKSIQLFGYSQFYNGKITKRNLDSNSYRISPFEHENVSKCVHDHEYVNDLFLLDTEFEGNDVSCSMEFCAPTTHRKSLIDINEIHRIYNDARVGSKISANDFNFLSASLETLPVGTWIIAMDNNNQDGSSSRVRMAYGLAVHLLHAGVPLKWIINPTKLTRSDIDLQARVSRVYPSSGGQQIRDFKTGPIAIFPGFEAQAATVINSFGNGIRVYELVEQELNVPIHSNLTHKPKVLVETENSDIHTDILSSAGLTSSNHYDVGNLTSIDNSSCYTLISVPHNNSISNAQRVGARTFVQNGGNFYAQCAAVRSFQNLTPALFSNAGFRDEPGVNQFLYDNPSEPSAQFEGDIEDEGGSLRDFGFTNEPVGGTRIVHDNDNDYKFYTGRIDGFNSLGGGYVHFMGGHNHDEDIDADRTYLNAVLRYAYRPTNCGLNLGPIAVDDYGVIDCDISSLNIDVLSNDSDPLGNGLTVNLLGSGANGSFINNNNGSVTYIRNSSNFWDGDQVNYEACSGLICSQGTLFINSTDPNNNLISGSVFSDDNENAIQDNGESGEGGVRVDLYQDNNNDGLIDNGDDLVSTQLTSASGDFDFSVASLSNCNSSNLTISTTKDGFVYQGDSNANYGTCEGLAIENYEDYNSRSFIEFDFSSLPIGCTIASAQLVLTHYNWSYWTESGTVTFRVRRITQSWSEGDECDKTATGSQLSWDNQPNYSGNYGSIVSNASDPDGTEYTVNVTSLVQDWIDGNIQNFGLALVPTAGDGLSYVSIYAEGSPNAPRIELSFAPDIANVDYLLSIDHSTIPSGSVLTTDSVAVASFTGMGQLDCSNDFGFTLNDQSCGSALTNPHVMYYRKND